MKKLIWIFLATCAGLSADMAFAQRGNSARFDRDLAACDRRGVNFERCMWDRGWQRGPGRHWTHNQNWHQPPRHPNWQSPPPRHWNQPPPPSRNQPRLSDMQQRALVNCNFLPPAEQPRCRATVMSTVGR